jgi:hypothetical protein
MSRTRHFAFGCSYSDWHWPTTADFIGTAFDEHYNFGVGGCSNPEMLSLLMDSYRRDKINPKTDFVSVGISSCCRFAKLRRKDDSFQTMHSGDIIPLHYGWNHQENKWKVLRAQDETPHNAIFNTLGAVKNIKTFLELTGIPHVIYQSMELVSSVPGFIGSRIDWEYTYLDTSPPPFPYYHHNYYNDSQKKEIDNWLVEILSIKSLPNESIDLFAVDNSTTTFWDDGDLDKHPSMDCHYTYFKKYFSDFDTPRAKKLLTQAKTTLSNQMSSCSKMSKSWQDLRNNFFEQY